jgi:hypothetical protein
MKNRFITALAVIGLGLMSFVASGTVQAATSAQGTAPPAIGSPVVKSYFPVRTSASGKAGSGNLAYHGGPVQASPHVYLVFWGKWWKSSCTGQQGHGVADENYLTSFFNGRGSGSDGLSAVATQYHGTSGQRSEFSGKVLYGTFHDCSNPPHSATQTQLGAVAAQYANALKAGHKTVNANTQIVVVSPSGTNPGGGFGSIYCAWHSWVSVGSLELSYTNEPYMPDAGGSCGANFIKSPLDGWSIVGGHEFMESVNDPQLSAWWDASGFEIGDKCAWTGIFVQSLTTGKFAEQPEWSNAGSNCADSDHVTVTNPGTRTTRVHHAASLQISGQATTVYISATVHRALTYTATGLPAGLHISSSGKITGTPTHIATYTVHVTGTEAVTTVHATATFTWKVTS